MRLRAEKKARAEILRMKEADEIYTLRAAFSRPFERRRFFRRPRLFHEKITHWRERPCPTVARRNAYRPAD